MYQGIYNLGELIDDVDFWRTDYSLEPDHLYKYSVRPVRPFLSESPLEHFLSYDARTLRHHVVAHRHPRGRLSIGNGPSVSTVRFDSVEPDRILVCVFRFARATA